MAEGSSYEVGQGYVQLTSSAKGLQKKVNKDLSEIRAEKEVKLELDASRLRAEAAKVQAELARLAQEKANPTVDLDISAAEAKRTQIAAKLEELSGKKASPKVDADTAEAQRQLAAVEQKLTALNAKKASIDVDADIASAQAKLDSINRRASQLESQRVQLQVDADAAGAITELDAVRRAAAAVDGKRAHVNVSADGAGSTISLLFGVAGAMGAVSAAAPAMAAAAAVGAGALGALGQGAAAALLGFSGIGDALSATEQAEKAAATTASSSAGTRASSARQVQSAVGALAQAQTQANRAAVTGAQQVSDAEQALGAARRDADRTAVSGARQVSAARTALADAATSAAERVQAAERNVASTQQSVRYAQEALTEARRDAAEANEDLRLSLSGVAISERRAQLSLQKARAALAKGSSDPLEQQSLQLDVDEASQNLAEVQERYGDLRQQQAEFARTGVQGTSQVTAATRNLQSAEAAAAEARRSLTAEQVAGSRQVRAAQDALTQAQGDAAAANVDAQDRVRQAAVAVGRAQQQAGWQQADAARSVTDAQRALQDAMTSTAATGVASNGALAYAMSKLSPAGREFVDFLNNEWKPAWEGTSSAIAERMLPGIEAGMRSLITLQPLFTRGLADSGAIIGDLAARGGALAASPAFQSSFGEIIGSNNRNLASMGDAGLHLFGAMTDLYAVAGPVAERFVRLIDYSAQAFESWIIGERATGDLERGLQSAGDTLMWIGGVLVDVGGNVLTVAGNLAPLGAAALETVRYVTDLVAGLTDLAGPVGTSVIVGLGAAAVATSKLGTAMAGLSAAGAAGGIAGFARTLSFVLNPAALYASQAMSSFHLAARSAGASAAGAVYGLTGSANAAGKTATAVGGAANVVGRLGSALPLLGVAVAGVALANDAMNSSFDEGVAALAAGGAAAAAFRAELVRNDQVTQQAHTAAGGFASFLGYDWVRANLLGIQSSDQFNAANDRRRASMSALQLAQEDASIAQGNYEQKLREFGPTSGTAQLALQALTTANRNVEIQQLATRNATDLATASVLYQSQQIMGTLNADLAKQQSLLQVEQAQKTYNDAVSRNGPSSLEARSAYVQYEQSLLAGIASVQQAAQKQYELEGRTDAAAQAQRDADTAALNMANTVRGNIPDALAKYIGSMDAGRLSAINARVKTDEFGNAVVLLPNGKAVPISAPGAIQARDQVNELRGAIERLQRMGTVTIPMQVAGGVPTGPDLRNPTGNGQVPIFRGYARGGEVQYFPTGGAVAGAGSATSDSIAARLSNGEYVINASAVQRVGVPALDAINALGFARGGPVGYAAGGAVAPKTATPAATSAAVIAPAGDPAAAQAAATATDELAASMATATTQAAVLNPALVDLAAVQQAQLVPAQTAVTLGQQAMVATGIVPLVGQMLSSLFPTLAQYQLQTGTYSVGANTALQGSQLATRASTTATAVNTAGNNAAINASNTTMSLVGQQQLANLRAGQVVTQGSTTYTAALTGARNADMMISTGNMSATNQNHLANLRGAQGVTSGSTTAFADAFRAQMGRTMPDSANPIRWVINFPIRSLTDAWNNLDGQFALGKRVNPYLPNFAAGGLLRGPGSGTSDSILGVGSNGVPTARVSNGEFVVRQAVAKRVTPFLSALNSGDGEALQAAGGSMAAKPRTFRGNKSGIGLAAGGPVEQRIQQAFGWLSGPARGARYVYGGGTDPRRGMDCSSMQSAVTHILSGRSPNSGRIGTTASMPWGGFARGQSSRYVIGNKPSDHMASTLAGRNVEQHGPTGTPFSFPSRWGADAPYFTSRYFLPEVGGSFVSGGVGAGGGIDIGPIIDGAFAKTYQQIADVPKFFGPSMQVGRDQGVAKSAADAVKAKATEAVSAATASMGGGVDISGISGPVVEQVRQVAARYGWGGGAEWDAIMRIVAKESSWNPNAASRVSSARGLFQKMTSIHGPVEPTAAGQANWGLNYIRGRYGTPSKAWAFHQSHNFYDQGGEAVGRGLMLKDVIAPERVLPPRETQSYNTLTELLRSRSGMRLSDSAAPPAAPSSSSTRPLVAHIYDSDDQLLGTMRGIAHDSIDEVAVAFTDGRLV